MRGVASQAAYCDNKHKERRKAKYIKAHAIVGTHTHVVTYVKPTEGHVSDMNELEGLVAKSTASYPAKEISADAGYLSKANAEIISNYKAVPYIDFRDDSVGTPWCCRRSERLACRRGRAWA